MNRESEDNHDYRVSLNKTIKLHEVVIENKFKDIRMQNDLDRKSMSEIVSVSVKNLKGSSMESNDLGKNKTNFDQIIKDMAFMRQELILHSETVAAKNTERIM